MQYGTGKQITDKKVTFMCMNMCMKFAAIGYRQRRCFDTL